MIMIEQRQPDPQAREYPQSAPFKAWASTACIISMIVAAGVFAVVLLGFGDVPAAVPETRDGSVAGRDQGEHD